MMSECDAVPPHTVYVSGQFRQHSSKTFQPISWTVPAQESICAVCTSWGHLNPAAGLVTGNGQVYTWGFGEHGKLGHGDDKSRDAPTLVSPQLLYHNHIRDIGMGKDYTVFLTDNGQVFACGSNKQGQHGAGIPGGPKHVPIPLTLPFASKKVTCGRHHTVLLSTEGIVHTCGSNECGQLGQNTSTKLVAEFKPVVHNLDPSSSPLKFIDIAAGGQHTVLLANNFDMFTCGWNDHGQLGVGSEAKKKNQTILQKVNDTTYAGSDRWAFVSAGGEHTVCVSGLVGEEQGDLYTWGWGKEGQLGTGTTTDKHTPAMIPDCPVTASWCGRYHTIVKSDGKLLAFGDGEYGKLGNGDAKRLLTPTAVWESKVQYPIHVACGDKFTIMVTCTDVVECNVSLDSPIFCQPNSPLDSCVKMLREFCAPAEPVRPKQSSELEQKYKQINRKYAKQQNVLKELEADKEQVIAELMAEYDKHQEFIQRLEEQRQQQDDEIDKLQLIVQELEREKEQESYQNLKAAVQELKDENVSLQTQRDDVIVEYNKQKEAMLEFEKENVSLQEKVLNYEQQHDLLQELQHEKESLQTQHQRMLGEYSHVHLARQQLEKDKAVLQAEYDHIAAAYQKQQDIILNGGKWQYQTNDDTWEEIEDLDLNSQLNVSFLSYQQTYRPVSICFGVNRFKAIYRVEFDKLTQTNIQTESMRRLKPPASVCITDTIQRKVETVKGIRRTHYLVEKDQLDTAIIDIIQNAKDDMEAVVQSLFEMAELFKFTKGEVILLKDKLKKAGGKPEAAVLWAYSLDSWIYEQINQVLRNELEEMLRICAPFVRSLLSAVYKTTSDFSSLPSTPSHLYRRINDKNVALKGGVTGTYPVDRKFTWNTFTSTSIIDNDQFGDVLFAIEFDQKAIDGSLYISPFSEFPEEHEVLLPPGFMLKVIASDDNTKTVRLKMMGLMMLF